MYAPIRNLIGLFLIVIFSIPASAQIDSDKIIDSLRNELLYAEDSLQAYLLLDLCIEYCYKNDPDSAMIYALQAYDLASRLEHKTNSGKALFYIGHCHQLQDNFKEAEKYLLEAATIFKVHNEEKYLCKTYNSLGQILTIYGAYSESIAYYEQALNLAKKLNYHTYSTAIVSGMANNYSAIGDFTKAFMFLEESKDLIRHRPHLINYYGILGDVYRSVGKVKKSLVAFNAAIDLCNEFEDQFRLAFMFRAVGDLYAEMGNYEKSADYFFKTLKLNESFKSNALEAASYLGLGNLYKLWENFEASTMYYEKALKLSIQHQMYEQVTLANLGLAQIYSQKQSYDKVQKYLDAGLKYALEINSVIDIIHCHLELSDLFLAKNDNARALDFLTEAQEFLPKEESAYAHYNFSILARRGAIYLDIGNASKSLAVLSEGLEYINGGEDKNELANFYENLSFAHERLNNPQGALKYFKNHIVLKDSLQYALNSKKLISIRTNYEVEEKEKAIQILQKEKEIQKLTLTNQEEVLSRRSYYLLALSLILVLAIGFFWALFNRYKWRKKTEQLKLINSKIVLEKTHLETKQQLEISELRSRFFTNVSHEFRTPLTLILGPLESIIAKNKKVLPESLRVVYRNAQKLLGLVNETLDLSKLESGHLVLVKKDFDFKITLQRIIGNFQSLSVKKKINIHLDWQAKRRMVAMDQTKIDKAISNLISNALEFSTGGQEINIVVSEKSKEELKLVIIDQGVGISPEHQALIFDRYYQVDNENLRGTGIGLALTKEIIELHNGTIQVESELGVGATFSLALPWGDIKKEEVDKISESNEIENGKDFSNAVKDINSNVGLKEKPVILVVEDQQEVRNYIADLLHTQGQVVKARNGSEGLELAKKLVPDLVVSDIMMPEMEGLEFTKQLKNNFETSHIPVVLLTAKASTKSKISGLKTGADDYITKPFIPEELQIRCYNLIQQRKKLQKLFSANQEIVSKDITVNELDEKFLQKAIALVRQRLDDPGFNVERFSQEIGISRTNLYTKLKSLTGKNIVGFIRTLRIQAAAKYIQSNSGNMNEISYKVGFNNRQSFIKSFKLEMGLTPSEFKKKKVVTNIKL